MPSKKSNQVACSYFLFAANSGAVNSNLLWVAAATFAVLATGTAIRLASLRGASRDTVTNRIDSLKTWWVLAIVVVTAALLGRTASVVLFAVCSAMAMRELVRLWPDLAANRGLLFVAYSLLPLNYFWIWLGWSNVFVVFLPLATLMLSSILLIATRQTQGFVRQLSRMYFGVLLTTYCLAHAVLLFNLPPASNPAAGASGWFLFLVLLTESNDIAQALVGRRMGKRKIAPRVSPNKTWEGFLGGVATTILLAVPLAPWLTPLDYFESIAAGVVIAAAGFLGDLTMSAVKRDAGVSDSGSLLPGQGGILDRLDSLTFSAPAFYYFISFIVQPSLTGHA